MSVRSPLKTDLSRLLFERRWTDGELAARAGLLRLRVNRLKNRRLRPTVRDALLIGAALGLRVHRVFRLPHSDGNS